MRLGEPFCFLYLHPTRRWISKQSTLYGTCETCDLDKLKKCMLMNQRICKAQNDTLKQCQLKWCYIKDYVDGRKRWGKPTVNKGLTQKSKTGKSGGSSAIPPLYK